jgi:hypothetical protein
VNDLGGYTGGIRQGWLSRLGGAFKGMIGGIVLLVVAFGLQFWNEGRTHRRDALLAEARATVQSADAATASRDFDGRLVHVSADAIAAVPVADAEFGVSVPALALRRRVEMFQWVEKESRRTEKKPGGGERRITEYRHEKRWEDDWIDSSRFERRSGHENPASMPYRGAVWRADDVRVGAYTLAPELASRIDGWRRVESAGIALPPNLAASFRADGDWFTTSANPRQPAVGDVRVRFDSIPAGAVSIVAAQEGARLVPHRSGEQSLALVERGSLSANAMFDAAAQSNSRTGWWLRFAGFAIACVGFGLLLRPLVVLADVVPLFGRLAGFGMVLVSGVLAAVFSLVGVGGGWLWTRPWLLALMLLVVVALVVFLVVRGRRATVSPVAPPPSPPPPPPPPAREA